MLITFWESINSERKCTKQEQPTLLPRVKSSLMINDLIEKLSQFPLDEEITIKDRRFLDSKGNLIIKIPTIEGIAP